MSDGTLTKSTAVSKGRSTFERRKSTTFDKVDRVEHVRLWRQCRPRQAVEFDSVASVYGRTGDTVETTSLGINTVAVA